MINEIRTIASRWGIESVLHGLEEVNQSTQITVGLLGDFSSGKTTLINELVGVPDLMPTRLEPCTANAGLVVAIDGLTQVECHRLAPDGSLTPISRVELEDLARGLVSGRPIVNIPSTPSLPAGVTLADTPGLGALEEGHFETTMAELPYLDAAIICIDVQKGGLTKSVAQFLQSPGVRHLQSRFLVALTHADLKSPADVAAVRSKTVQALSEVLGLPPADVSQRVVVAAAGPQAGTRGRADITEVQEAIGRVFLSRRASIAEERRLRAAQRLVPSLQDALTQRLAAVRATESEAAQRMVELRRARDAARAQQSAHRARLDDFQSALRTNLLNVCRAAAPAFAAATDEEALSAAGAALSARIATTIDASVAEHRDALEDFVTPDLGGLVGHVAEVNRYVNFGKSVATAALVAVVLPGPAGAGAVMSNAAQAGAGAAAAAGARAASQPGVLKRVLGGLLKDVNPLEFVGDVIGQKYKANSVVTYLEDLAAQVANDAAARLAATFEDNYFAPLQASLAEHSAQLAAAETDRTAELSTKQKMLRDIEADISALLLLR